MFVRYCSPCLPMFLRCLMLMLSGPVELLFLLFLIATTSTHHHLRVIKLVFSIFPHISLLYR